MKNRSDKEICAMEAKDRLTEDAALRFLERGGKWQWIQMALLLFTFVSTVQTTFVIVFTGFEPKFVCRDLELSLGPDKNGLNNHSTEIFDNACLVYNATSNSSVGCDSGFRYEVYKTESIVSEWNLICDKAYLSEVSQMLFTVGSAIGAALVAPLSDRVGRRLTFILMRLLTLLNSCAILFVPGITGFIVLRFLGGILTTANGLIRGVYLTELTSLRTRPVMTTVSGIFWGVSLCTMALCGHLMRGKNWRYIYAFVCASYFTIILEIMFLKESLIWLYANGRNKEASSILRKAMKANRITEEALKTREEVKMTLKEKETSPFDEDIADQSLICAVEFKKTINDDDKSNQRRLTIIDMMKSKTTRKFLFIISAVWFVTSLVYYGLSLMSSAMPGDRVLNFFLLGVVEIPSCAGLYIVIKRYAVQVIAKLRCVTPLTSFISCSFGRRKTMMMSYGLCGLSLLTAGICNAMLNGNKRVIVMQVVTFIGKCGISATFIMLYYYTTELLPTNFRTSGLGIGSFCSKIGSCLSPFSSVLLRLLPWGPGVIFGSFCLVVALLFVCVPETNNRQLPQTIIEIDMWEKNKITGVQNPKTS